MRRGALLAGAAAMWAAGYIAFRQFDMEPLLANLLAGSVVAIVGAIEKWRFRSLKTGLTLLAILGVFCIYGTMWYAANSSLGNHAIPMGKQRVFNAWWFFALLGLFFVQFTLSTWPVTKMSFATWSKRDFRRSASSYRHGRGRALVTPQGGRDGVTDVLRSRFTRVHQENGAWFAHRGLRVRWGPTIVHAGIVVILVAGLARIVMDRTGYILSDGVFVAAEGETTSEVAKPRFHDQAIGGSNFEVFEVPYDIRVLDFDEIQHPNSNTPAYFSTLLEVRSHETGEIRVAKLDMNHSFKIGRYEFHQSGYEALAPIDHGMRRLFDVRDAATGERIATTDTEPGIRVQVGEELLFLEVDGEAPGDAWRLYSATNPEEPVESGVLLRGPSESFLQVRVAEVFSHLAVRRTPEGELVAFNASSEPLNPAAKVDILRNGQLVAQSVLFLDPELMRDLPRADPEFDLALRDIRVARDIDEPDWNDPTQVLVEVAVSLASTGDLVDEQVLGAGLTGPPVLSPASTIAAEPPAPGARFAVYPLEPVIKHRTVLSVVNEPVVPYYIAGVVLIAIGAFVTFSGRYTTLHALWDEETGGLRVAMGSRFQKGPEPREFEQLLLALAGGDADRILWQSGDDEPEPVEQPVTEQPRTATPSPVGDEQPVLT